jgi:hypothetical protein
MAMVEGEWRGGCVVQKKGEHNGEQVLAVNGWLGWKISWRPESRVEKTFRLVALSILFSRKRHWLNSFQDSGMAGLGVD